MTVHFLPTKLARQNYLRSVDRPPELAPNFQLFLASPRPRMSDSIDPAPLAAIESVDTHPYATHHLGVDGDDTRSLPPNLRRIVDTLVELGDAVIVTTRDGTIVQWTSAAEALLGWHHDDTIGRSLIALLDPTPADVNAPLHLSLLGEKQWQGPAVVRQKDDHALTVHLSLTQLDAEAAGTHDATIVLRVRHWPDRSRSARRDPLDAELLRNALDQLDDIVFITESAPADSSAPRIIFANEAFERRTGFSRSEIIGLSPGILRGTESDTEAAARIDVALHDRVRIREELLCYSRAGEPLWLDFDIVPLTQHVGNCTQWIAVECSIPSPQGQEVALRAREERLRLAMNAVWDGLWDWHVPTGYCYYAPRWYAMLGYAEHALPPHIDTFLELLHPRDLPACEHALRDHFDGRTDTYALEVRLRTADNNWRYILTRGTVVERDNHGRPVRMVGTHTDIAERKQAELALRTSEDRFRTLAMASPLGIFLTDAAGNCTFVTPRMRDMWGAPTERLLGQGFLNAAHPDDKARVQAEWRKAVRDGEQLYLEYRVLRPDGEIRWVCERTAAHRDGESIAGFVGTVEDISAQKAAADDRRQLEAQMQHAQKLESLGILAGGIAHDFNNLLVGILGNVSIARDELPNGASADEVLGDIEASARRAAELTTQLLAYAGKGRFHVAQLDLAATVREMAPLIQSAISRRATLELEIDDTTPMIAADATQMRQVIMNLIANASESLDDRGGQITLRTGVTQLDDVALTRVVGADGIRPGEFVFLEVTDTGIGMSVDTLARLYDPFFTTKFTGRGLGLAATLGIVRGHRGALEVQSAPGSGTTFRVLFPATHD